MRTFILALLILFLVPTSASADWDPPSHDARPVPARVDREIAAALDFWHARGVGLQTTSVVGYVANDLDGPDVPAGSRAIERAVPGGSIFLEAQLVAAANRTGDGTSRRRLRNGRFVLAYKADKDSIQAKRSEAVATFHGVGHALGLGHTATGIMAGVTSYGFSSSRDGSGYPYVIRKMFPYPRHR